MSSDDGRRAATTGVMYVRERKNAKRESAFAGPVDG